MELIAQDFDHLLARFSPCIAPPLLDLVGSLCTWRLQSMQQHLPHLLKRILHLCPGWWGIELLSEFPEALTCPLVGYFDQAKKTYFILYRAAIETAYYHIWLALGNFGIELEEVSKPPAHFGNVEGGIGKPWLTARGACRAQFAVSGLHEDLPQLVLRCLVHPWSKQLLPLLPLFLGERTRWRPPPVGIVGAQLAVPANPSPVQLEPAIWQRCSRAFDFPESLFR